MGTSPTQTASVALPLSGPCRHSVVYPSKIPYPKISHKTKKRQTTATELRLPPLETAPPIHITQHNIQHSRIHNCCTTLVLLGSSDPGSPFSCRFSNPIPANTTNTPLLSFSRFFLISFHSSYFTNSYMRSKIAAKPLFHLSYNLVIIFTCSFLVFSTLYPNLPWVCGNLLDKTKQYSADTKPCKFAISL